MLNGKRILVAYSSGYGSTEDLAKRIGNILTEEGAEVVVLLCAEAKELEQYDAIIVGSPIRYDRWMPAAKSFIINNQEYLNQIPVAYFFSCLTLAIRNEATEKKANQYAEKLQAISSQFKPIDIGRFAGVLNYSKMPILLRIIFKVFTAIIGLKDGDYRDWDEIRQWTKNIASKLDAMK